MKKTSEFEIVKGETDNPVYCTACYRRCYLGTLAIIGVQDSYIVPLPPTGCPLADSEDI